MQVKALECPLAEIGGGGLLERALAQRKLGALELGEPRLQAESDGGLAPQGEQRGGLSGANARGARSATQRNPISVPSSARTGAAAWNGAGRPSTSRSSAPSWPPATMTPPFAAAPSWQIEG
jgi:hypothetical protein